MKFVVTGASGYIGRRLVSAIKNAGHDVLAFSRKPIFQEAIKWQFYDLMDVAPPLLPDDVDVVFHLAANTSSNSNTSYAELVAAKNLILAANNIGANFIFISSQSAQSSAFHEYGRLKEKIERLVLESGGKVVRLGMVYGGVEDGLFGKICNMVQNHRFLPYFLPNPFVQPIHIDDLVEALLCYGQMATSKIYLIAQKERVPFTEFLQAIANVRMGKTILWFPVPQIAIRGIIFLLKDSLSEKFGLNRLISLFSLPYMKTDESLNLLSLNLRPLSIGMNRSGKPRKKLLIEGYILIKYLLKARPFSSLTKRYVRAIESLRDGKPIYLPRVVENFHSLIALLDGASRIEYKNELNWRLNIALILAEASPQGYIKFLGADSDNSIGKTATLLVWLLMHEAMRRIGQILMYPFLPFLRR